MTAWMMGSIMAVAAVLLIHIDKNHVGIISPTINLEKLIKNNIFHSVASVLIVHLSN